MTNRARVTDFTVGMTGTTLSHYRLLERLGEGATAVVYKAEDLALGRAVALKLLPQSLSVDLGKIARFQHEARTTSTLNHPNICTIYEIGQHEDRHFIVMEYLEGRPLSRAIDGRPMEGYRLIELAIQMAEGLEAAHEARVIHRDLKPANIYVTHREHVKILDFGLATLMPAGSLRSLSSATWLSEPGGTGPYMSPEQTLGEPLDTRSDLFSFGVVLYEMATGVRPFTGATHASLIDAIRHERAFPARDLNTAVRDELDRIINKALEKNRKLRYQTASDISADLRRLKRDLDTGAQPMVKTPTPAVAQPADMPDSPEPTRRRSMGMPWVVAQLIGAAVIGGAFVSLGLSSHGGRPSSASGTPPDVTREPIRAAAAAPPAAPPAASTPSISAPSSSAPAPAPAPIAGVTPLATVPARPAATSVGAASIAATTTRSATEVEQALRIAEAKADLHLYAQALDTLRESIRAHGGSPQAPAMYLAMASIHERRGSIEDAIATYLDTAARYPADARAPQALFDMAGAILKSKRGARDVEASKIYSEIAGKYAASSWAPRALMARAEIEQRRRVTATDPVLDRQVPAALVTYRQIARDHVNSADREHALWRLSNLYLDLKRYDLAAEALRELGSRYSSQKYDAWFTAAEIYEKRLNDPAAARAAYAQVPPTSPHWDDAQKRLGTH